ncbi:hypothetical protein DPMN_186898 [Dreissena polymorpha]|uniref:Uncharacterized protein n=1 Tax=Dreissena polymorpha TaxID=45954 RepID=A0A9D4DMB7_DREPO|nr:hypothetical protein DPMN_186898 [Dreissena polymorpha]
MRIDRDCSESNRNWPYWYRNRIGGVEPVFRCIEPNPYSSTSVGARRSLRQSGTVAYCLGVSCRCPDGHDIVIDCLGVSCRCSAGLGDCFASSQTVWESPAGVKAVCVPFQTVWESPAGTLNATSGQSSAFLFMSRIFLLSR